MGETWAAALAAFAATILPPDDPERVFTEWLAENYRRLPEAIEELGLPPVAEGENLFERIRWAVTPALMKKRGLW